MRRIAAWGLLAALCLFAGCESGGPPAAARRSATPDLAMKYAVESRADLSSLYGQGVMRIADGRNKVGLKVNAEVVAADPEKLRIHADRIGGAVKIFDVVMLGQDVAFYVPTQRTLYTGTIDDLDQFAFQFRPDDVLRQMLHPETSLLLRHWSPSEPGAGDPPNAIIYEEAVPYGAPRLKVALDRRTGMLLAVTQLDEQHYPLWVKSFGDYRRVERGRRGRGGDETRLYPYQMAVSWPREDRLIELQFRRVDIDPVVLDEDFDLSLPDNVRDRAIREASIDLAAAAPPRTEIPD